MGILVKYPSRERPKQFLERLNILLEKAEAPDDLCFLFTFDQNDATMYPMATVLENRNLCGEVHYDFSKSKVHAVNRDMEKFRSDWDILLLMSDDMVCVQNGWDTIIKAGFDKDTDVLWHFDGYQADICTMPIMRRSYYSRFDYVYHPSYRSVFCDNEQTEVAKTMNVLKYDPRVLFQHIHPANTTGVIGDTLHVRNEMAWSVDERNYRQRKAKGFPR